MKTFVSIIFLAILAISLSGCTIVNERYRHRHARNEVIVTYSQHRPGRPAHQPFPNVTHHGPRQGRPRPGRMFP